MSPSGAPIEQIARLAGHTTTNTTEEVYRKQIDQAAMAGPEILDAVRNCSGWLRGGCGGPQPGCCCHPGGGP